MSNSWFKIKPHDVQWKAWMAHFAATEPERVRDAESNGELTAFGGRWPDSAKRVQVQRAPRNPGGDA